jgi:hypothetical protein
MINPEKENELSKFLDSNGFSYSGIRPKEKVLFDFIYDMFIKNVAPKKITDKKLYLAVGIYYHMKQNYEKAMYYYCLDDEYENQVAMIIATYYFIQKTKFKDLKKYLLTIAKGNVKASYFLGNYYSCRYKFIKAFEFLSPLSEHVPSLEILCRFYWQHEYYDYTKIYLDLILEKDKENKEAIKILNNYLSISDNTKYALKYWNLIGNENLKRYGISVCEL